MNVKKHAVKCEENDRIVRMIELPTIQTVIQKCYNKPLKAGTIAICAIPAMEMALRFIGNTHQVYYLGNKGQEHELSTNFIGAVFLTASLIEFFPGGRVVGAIVYIFYVTFNNDNDVSNESDRTFSSRVIFYSMSKIKEYPFLATALFFALYFFNGKTAARTSAMFSRVWKNI